MGKPPKAVPSLLPASLLAALLAASGPAADPGDAAPPLLELYESLHPFHEHLRTPMPVEECDGDGRCGVGIRMEENPERFRRLLERTERERDVDDPGFRDSPLGRRHRELGNFMDIRQRFAECASDARALTGKTLGMGLDRLAANASSSPLAGRCGAAADAALLSEIEFGFMADLDDVSEALLEDELLLDSLRRSVEARISFERRFNGEDPGSGAFRERLARDLCRGTAPVARSTRRGTRTRMEERDVCGYTDARLVRALIGRQADRVSRREPDPMDAAQVEADLNGRIGRLNGVLEGWNRKKAELLSEWEREDAQTPARARARRGVNSGRRRARDAELRRLKGEALDEYRELRSRLHADGAGKLLQTDAVRAASRSGALDGTRALWLGFGGFEPEVLEDPEADFPTLEAIDQEAASAAVAEALSRTKDQVQDLLERRRRHGPGDTRRNLAHLLKVSPASAGRVLMNNPGHAGAFCDVMQEIALDERNRAIAETGTYIVLGVGVTVATAATLGGALPMAATIGGVAAGAAFTAGDYAYQTGRARESRQRHRELLDSYLSGTGDDRSIEDIRGEWQAMLESDQQGRMGLWFGLFDAMGVAPAVRGATFLRLARSVPGLNRGTSTNRLLYLISRDNGHIATAKRLMDQRPPEEAGRLLAFMAELPADKQRALLRALSEQGAVDPSALARAPRVAGLLTEAELEELGRVVSPEQGRASEARPALSSGEGRRTPTVAGDLTNTAHLPQMREHLSAVELDGLDRAVSPIGRSLSSQEGPGRSVLRLDQIDAEVMSSGWVSVDENIGLGPSIMQGRRNTTFSKDNVGDGSIAIFRARPFKDTHIIQQVQSQTATRVSDQAINSLLKRTLNQTQKDALLSARNQRPKRYTPRSINNRIHVLSQAGFDKDEIRALIAHGLTGLPIPEPSDMNVLERALGHLPDEKIIQEFHIGDAFEIDGSEWKIFSLAAYGSDSSVALANELGNVKSVEVGDLPELAGITDPRIEAVITNKHKEKVNSAIDIQNLSLFLSNGDDPLRYFSRSFMHSFVSASAKSPHIIENSNGAFLFHGSGSASLLTFTSNKHVGGLRPTGALLEQGVVPFSGELGAGISSRDRSLGNNAHLSTATLKDISKIKDYYLSGGKNVSGGYSVEQSRINIERYEEILQAQASDNEVTEMEAIMQAIRSNSLSMGSYLGTDFQRKIEIENIRIQQWETLSSPDQALVQENFPVLYGLDPDLSKKNQWRRSGPQMDEIQIEGGVSISEIASIFVPKDKVDMVQKMLDDQGIEHIKVSPLEDPAETP